ncbi:MAG: choice-of-anchor H family protein [Gammaproteobacteria bacterium]
MNTKNKSAQLVFSALAAAATLLAPALISPAQASDSTSRTVRSASGRTSERSAEAMRNRSTFVESEVLTVERPHNSKESDSTTAAGALEEAWIYDADVELFDDFDADGYYTYLRVSFDADSIYTDHYVYARLFLTLDGVNWDEYHITDDFLIEGSSPFDDYEVETELVSGFPPGLYDALIELYDAELGYYLGEYGPAESSAFSLLPLEDIDNDTVEPAVVITTERGGGGALGPTSVIGLGLLAACIRRNRRRLRQSRNNSSALL